MNPKISGILIFIIVLADFITGAIAYPYVSDSVALAFGLPISLLVLFGVWALLPAIDPIAKGFVGFRHIYDFFWILLSAMLTYAYALKLGAMLGWHVVVLQAILPAIAILFFVVGMLLPKLKRNWFFGVRTPWTLSSNEDWDKTHQFSRPLFMFAGIVIFIGTFTPRDWSLGLLIGAIALSSIVSVLYSYFIFHHNHVAGR